MRSDRILMCQPLVGRSARGLGGDQIHVDDANEAWRAGVLAFWGLGRRARRRSVRLESLTYRIVRLESLTYIKSPRHRRT